MIGIDQKLLEMLPFSVPGRNQYFAGLSFVYFFWIEPVLGGFPFPGEHPKVLFVLCLGV